MIKRLCLLLTLILSGCGGGTSQNAGQASTAQPTLNPIQFRASLVATTGPDLFAQNQISLPAAFCDGSLSPSQTQGPYYKADTPRQNVLWREGMPGKKLFVVGYVLDQKCQPIVNAWMDFWQAD